MEVLAVSYITRPNCRLGDNQLLLQAFQVVIVVKNLPAHAEDIRDPGSIPGLGRSPGRRCGNPLQYSCLGNPMDRGARQATVLGVTKSWIQLKGLSMHTCIQLLWHATSNIMEELKNVQSLNWLLFTGQELFH